MYVNDFLRGEEKYWNLKKINILILTKKQLFDSLIFKTFIYFPCLEKNYIYNLLKIFHIIYLIRKFELSFLAGSIRRHNSIHRIIVSVYEQSTPIIVALEYHFIAKHTFAYNVIFYIKYIQISFLILRGSLKLQ